VDDEGNSYVVGYAAEAATFGTDTISPPASNGEGFIAKLDNGGNRSRAQQSS
jgi:hypothetical protein